MVLDDASDLKLLHQLWPSNQVGSILLTSRNPNLITGLADRLIRVQAMPQEIGIRVLSESAGLSWHESSWPEIAELVQLLGGLPLALHHIGSYMAQRKLTPRKVLAIWEEDEYAVTLWMADRSSTESTLDTVWLRSISNLEGNARSLLNLLCYLNPFRIDESELIQSSFKPGSAFNFLKSDRRSVNQPILKLLSF